MDAVVAYDLTKEYEGQAALSGLNLQVPQGEAFACVGERGCGKTTLVRLLSGLCRPTSGECTVLGLSPSHEPHSLACAAPPRGSVPCWGCPPPTSPSGSTAWRALCWILPTCTRG